jgi:beta-lactamase regulating signal transducer with metallopeptidase domain
MALADQTSAVKVAATKPGTPGGEPAANAAARDATAAEPAATAAARVSRAWMVLGALGLASSAFVVVRLIETWRVTPHSTSHQISILGQKLSYPTANFAAVVVVFLALLGLAVTVMTVLGAVREVLGSIRFRRLMGASEPELLDDVFIFRDEQPRAFCAGLLNPRVYVSSGAVATLDEPALRAVVLHERHHARRRDPLRLATGKVLVRALFFMPGLPELIRRQQALAELSADESAVNAGAENRSALARAMLSFSDGSEPGEGIDPARVDHLLGEPPSWRFPALLCLAGLSVLALMTAFAVLAGQVASGSGTLAAPFLSSQPCIVVLAMIPAALGLVVLQLVRRAWPGRSPSHA